MMFLLIRACCSHVDENKYHFSYYWIHFVFYYINYLEGAYMLIVPVVNYMSVFYIHLLYMMHPKMKVSLNIEVINSLTHMFFKEQNTFCLFSILLTHFPFYKGSGFNQLWYAVSIYLCI